METKELELKGLMLIMPSVFTDNRGYFFESYNSEIYASAGIPPFAQDNESFSYGGVLRGLHYQLPPYGQGKLVRVVTGEVMDIAVDIRPDSPTLGQYHAEMLSSENKKQLWIPEGFAHGFLVLSDQVVFSYKCTQFYKPEYERGIQWNDPDLAIDWGGTVSNVSARDVAHSNFKTAVAEYAAHLNG